MPKIPKKINKILHDFINEVNDILGSRIKCILLYGSYARGDYNKDSDIDIMILTNLSDEEINTYNNILWEKCADIEIDDEVVISPLIRNIDSFNSWLDAKPFYMNIVKEGVVLHGEKEW